MPVFGETVPENELLFERALQGMKKISGRIGDFYDPTCGAGAALDHWKSSRHSLFIAYAEINGQIAMTMFVLPDLQKNTQTHMWIFKSLSFQVKAILHEWKNDVPLSVPLHSFAAQRVACHYIISRPRQKMKEMLINIGFKEYLIEEEAGAMLGETSYCYTNQYGVGDKRYSLIYHQNSPALHAHYNRLMNPLLCDLATKEQEPEKAQPTAEKLALLTSQHATLYSNRPKRGITGRPKCVIS